MGKQLYKLRRTYIGKLKQGDDLLDEITKFAIHHKINVGEIRGLGAVQKSVVWYYNQQSKKYETLAFDEPLEILSLYGNISIRGHDPFPHCHIILGDKRGKAVGGHLAEGTIIFAAEIMIHEFDGELIQREEDIETGLYLWDYKSELIA